MTDLSELRKLAEAATPGPWEVSGIRSKLPKEYDSIWVLVNDRRVIALPCVQDADYVLNFRDAAYIAAANPQAILALLDERDALTARVKELEVVVEWYGEQTRLCRLIHSGGDAGRHALAEDGGRRAAAARRK